MLKDAPSWVRTKKHLKYLSAHNASHFWLKGFLAIGQNCPDFEFIIILLFCINKSMPKWGHFPEKLVTPLWLGWRVGMIQYTLYCKKFSYLLCSGGNKYKFPVFLSHPLLLSHPLILLCWGLHLYLYFACKLALHIAIDALLVRGSVAECRPEGARIC